MRGILWMSALACALAWPLESALGEAELTLAQCRAAALRSSPDIRATVERVEAARAMLGQARSAYWPRIAVQGSYTQTDNPPQAFMMRLNQRTLDMASPGFDPNNPEETENVRVSLTAAWQLYDFGKRAALNRAAGAGVQAGEGQLDAVLSELLHETTRAYNSVLQGMSFRTVQAESVRSLRESLRVASERLDAGSATRSDVLNLEVQLAQAQEELIRASNGVLLAVAALNTAIGEPVATPDNIRPPATLPAVSVPPSPAPDAVAARPELRAARRAADAARARYEAMRRARLPVVNAFGSYDQDGEEFGDFEDSYMAGVQAEWQLFSGGERLAAERQAQAEWRAANAGVTALENRLAFELKQAALQGHEAHARLQVATQAIGSAEEALRIVREQYRQGAADITQLLASEVALAATRTREAAAYYDYQVALSNIERATGRIGDESRTEETSK